MIKSKADRTFTIDFCKALWDFNEYANLKINQSRLLHIYIGLINPTSPPPDEKRKQVCILLSDIKKIFDIQNISTFKRDLKEFPKEWYNRKTGVTEKIFDTVEIRKTQLFEEIIVLKCTTSAEKYFFGLGEKGNSEKSYVEYNLNNVIKLKSHRHIVLYQNLINLMNVGCIEMGNTCKTLAEVKNGFLLSVDKLSYRLNLQPQENYKSFSDISNKFLKKCIKAINENTNLSIDYITNKDGHIVKNLLFQIHGNDIDGIEINAKTLTKEEIKEYSEDCGIDLQQYIDEMDYEIPADISEEELYQPYTEEMITALEESAEEEKTKNNNINTLYKYFHKFNDDGRLELIDGTPKTIETAKKLIEMYYDKNELEDINRNKKEIEVYDTSIKLCHPDLMSEDKYIYEDININNFDLSVPFQI